MKVDEAKDLVLSLVSKQLPPASSLVDAASPDQDVGKFVIAGKTARVIHHYDGWMVPINLGWFEGGFDPPEIHQYPFFWYAFAIPKRPKIAADHYLICDYLQMREWVLDFEAPLGNDHRDHNKWRADLRLYLSPIKETLGYFRWGDEVVGANDRIGREFVLDNILTVTEPVPAGSHVGGFGPGGESAAHKLLKLYVAGHPVVFGMSPAAQAHVEYPFKTGDRVDVMFSNHQPHRTVVEVEVEGEANVCIGIQQAIKYRSLAAVDAGYPVLSPNVRSLCVAYDTDYPKAKSLAQKYEVSLASVDRKLVLGAAV